MNLIILTHAKVNQKIYVHLPLLFYAYKSNSTTHTHVVSNGGAYAPVTESVNEIEKMIVEPISLTHANTNETLVFNPQAVFYHYKSMAAGAVTHVVSNNGAFVPVKESTDELSRLIDVLKRRDIYNECSNNGTKDERPGGVVSDDNQG